MEIHFVKSDCPSPDNGMGYTVWTNQYTKSLQPVGFISNKNLPSMKEYFISEGYDVSVIDKPDQTKNIAFYSEVPVVQQSLF